MVQHVNIPSEQCHEPKHITNATTSDAGKVITPSAEVAGQSVLRNLAISEITGLSAALAAVGLSTGSLEDDVTALQDLTAELDNEKLDKDSVANLALIADPGTATAEDVATKLNALITALITGDVMAGV